MPFIKRLGMPSRRQLPSGRRPVNQETSTGSRKPLALALCVDHSASMGCDFSLFSSRPDISDPDQVQAILDRVGLKMEQAKEAAVRILPMLGPMDALAIVAFDHEVDTSVPLTDVSNVESIRRRIASIEARGGTDIMLGLRAAHRQLSSSRAETRHIILLSDGQSFVNDEEVYSIVRSGVTISAVAVGGDADEHLLRRIAEIGRSRFYKASDSVSLSRIFVEETAKVVALVPLR